MDCKGYVWAVLQGMSENAYASVVSSTIFFTPSWLIFVTLQTRLQQSESVRHRFALDVTETQDVQNVLDVSLTWCNMNGGNHLHWMQTSVCSVPRDPLAAKRQTAYASNPNNQRKKTLRRLGNRGQGNFSRTSHSASLCALKSLSS